MNASVEWLDRDGQVGLIRTHADGNTFRSPYTWSVVVSVSKYAPKDAILKGVYRKPTLAEARAVRKLLREIGVSDGHYERAGVRRPRRRSVRL